MTTPPLKGIHHVKFAVSDLNRSLTFYEEVFHARRIVEWDHKHADGLLYAHILDIPGLGTYVELRLNAEHAEKHRLFNTLTIAVENRAALDQWESRRAPLSHSRRDSSMASRYRGPGSEPTAPLHT